MSRRGNRVPVTTGRTPGAVAQTSARRPAPTGASSRAVSTGFFTTTRPRRPRPDTRPEDGGEPSSVPIERTAGRMGPMRWGGATGDSLSNAHGNGNGHGRRERGAGRKVLITGGAGFIGSHLADELLRHGYSVRALDNLSPQVHGPDRRRPDYLDPDVELIVGDVRDPDAVRQALTGVDAVYHLAAAVGVGQSMYEIANYTSLNNLGTAVLLEGLIERSRKRPIERLVVASSMSIYG